MFLRKGIPIIRISNLPQNASFVDLDDCIYYKKGNYISFEVHNGDLLIAMSGATTGKIAIYNKKTLAYLNQRVGLFKSTNSDSLYYPFLYAFVSTPVFKRQLSTRLIAGAQPNISSSDIESIRISIPQKNEQEKIAHLMLLLDERIATQNKIIEKLQSLIKGIRNDVFGKLRKNIGFNAVVGDVLDYEQPQSYIVEDTEYTNEGTPVLTANKAFVLGYTLETDGIYDKGDCIIFDDFTLDCKYVDFPFKVKSSAIKILTAKNKELLRYTFEFLKYLDLSTEEHKRHYIAETQNQEIILPTEQMVKTIAHIFSTLSLRMETAVKQRDVFEKQKQYLLRQMFI